MSYVLHVYRMTYNMTCRNTFLFIPRNGILCPPFFGIYLFHPLDIAKNESFLGGFAPPATWANHRSVFNGIRFYSCQNIVSTKTQQGMFRVTRNLLGYSQKNLPVGDLFLRSRTIKMERTYKKTQKVSDFSHRQFRFYIFVQN